MATENPADVVVLKNVQKFYQRHEALHRVNFNVERGVTGLLGPNGAGKSTLIKVILGLVKVSAGSGTVLGLRLGKDGRRIRERVGYLPEDDCYIPGLTGIETVQFSAVLSGLPAVEALRRSHEILDFCGMKQERYRPVGDYSTGMRQKIKFAAAIVHDPDFLIFDEPTSGLDPEERENLLNRIRILAEQHDKSVLISTHILPDVQSVCDHAVILAQGRIVLSENMSALNAPANPTYAVRIEGDPEQFGSAMRRAGLETKAESEVSWRVSSSRDDIVKSIWAAANQSGATILSLEPARNDLEEVFIKAVEESENASQ